MDVCSNTEGIDNILYAACSRYSADYSEHTSSVITVPYYIDEKTQLN